MYTVLVRGLELYGYHGISPEEQAVGHRYKLDLELAVKGAADATDAISDTVDYAIVADQVTALFQAKRLNTVERLARIVADALLERHPAIESVSLTLVKRLPPAPMIAEEAGVRLTVARRAYEASE